MSLVAVAVLLIAGLAGYAIYSSQRPTGGFAVPTSASSDRNGIKVGNGPVTVEIYLDYLCPACRLFEESAQPTLDRYLESGRVNIVYRPVAILDRLSTNRYSSRAAAGAGCAADQGKLVEYTKALYAQQPPENGAGHTNKQIADLAAQAGLPRDAFEKCLDDDRYGDWVKGTTDAMAARGLNSTPTVFVNGKQLKNPAAELATAIDAA
jgi:protein-disulfide isomerase